MGIQGSRPMGWDFLIAPSFGCEPLDADGCIHRRILANAIFMDDTVRDFGTSASDRDSLRDHRSFGFRMDVVAQAHSRSVALDRSDVRSNSLPSVSGVGVAGDR